MNVRTVLSLSYHHYLTTPGGLGTTRDTPVLSRSPNWSTGSGAGQVNVGWHDYRTLAYGTNEDLDLSDVAGLQSAWLEAIEFDAVKSLIIQNEDAAETLILKPSVADGWNLWITGLMYIRPGATVLLAAGDSDATGYTVAAGTNDSINLAASGSGGGGIDYYIALVGIT